MSLEKLGVFGLGILIMATIVFYYAGVPMGLEAVGLLVLLPGLFMLTILNDKFYSLFGYTEAGLFLLFLLLTFASVFYDNVDYDNFNFTVFKILAALMGAYVAIALGKKEHLEVYFHIGFIVCFFAICYFESALGTFNIATFYAPTVSRHDFTYNANYYSYISLFANFSIFRLRLKYKNLYTSLGLILIPLLGITISFTTQSRSGILFILLVNAIFWFWINKGNPANTSVFNVRKLALVVLTIVFAIKFADFYANSSIQNRVSDVGSDSRGGIILSGLEMISENPLTGVGLGNFAKHNYLNTFSHNSYIEALAEHGLILGSFIILIFILPVFKSYKLFSNHRTNPELKLSFIFFGIFALFNNIYVFYKASFAMMYFFLMLGIFYRLVEKYKIRG